MWYILLIEDSRHIVACTLTALYLPGIAADVGGGRRKWPSVERALRTACPTLGEVAGELRKVGLWFEASLLDAPGTLCRAEAAVLAGRVLTTLSFGYPARWLEVLKESAPPALWIRGPMPSGKFLSIVGVRHPSAHSGAFARDSAISAVESGFNVVSGGALGCDRCAASGALWASKAAGGETRLVEILPFGLLYAKPTQITCLSLRPPTQDFTTAAAMERNALIYALGERSLVAEARFREGGAWHGAADCLRRRLSPLCVRADGSKASAALQALGARLVSDPAKWFEAPVLGGTFQF